MNTRLAATLAMAIAVASSFPAAADSFRPPSVPLVTFDPYLSIWSAADHLTDRPTQHWTTRHHSLVSLIRVDGETFRLMGNDPSSVPPLPQTNLRVTPTRSIYDFENDKIHVTLTFLRPALPGDLDDLALPLNYLTWEVRSKDGRDHAVSLYDSSSAQIVVNNPNEAVVWSRDSAGPLTLLRTGTQDQPVLGSKGDDHRIDWGYLYVAAESAQTQSSMGPNQAMLQSFVSSGALPADDTDMPQAVNDVLPVLAFVFDLGRVGAEPVTRQVEIGYDELYAIKYFGKKLLPYWKRNGATMEETLRKAAREYPKLAKRCAEFDDHLMADATRVGGEKYAQMCALAYRQCACACGLAADANKQPLFFTKENTSNGDIATVDVFFPMDPQWVLLSPAIAKATLVPILSYAASWHWKFPNAPHDLGTYPIASGTDDGGEGMPVEESGNMLILCDAVCQIDGNASFVSPWWPKLSQWAEYLEKYGLDPENQLCTDDFMGHLAHNANLSVKAILGLAAYGDLCRLRGDNATAERYRELAKTDAAHWLKVAADDNGAYRLAFDKPGTWSQKYNLVWDQILHLNIFPPEVAQKEVVQYHKAMEPYGFPLDSRTKLTKTDWSFWSATLAATKEDFESLTDPIYDYLNHTTARSPFVDSYITTDIKSDGMHARPVIGGVFIKMLADHDLWMKWAHADNVKVGPWAPLPQGPKITEVIPTARTTAAVWSYTTHRPSEDWAKPDFDASSWPQGPASFGTSGTPGAIVHTRWDTDDIWLRRQITLPAHPYSDLEFYVDHDEDVQIYVNGILAAKARGFNTSYEPLDIAPAARALLKPDATLTLAVHCHQTTGGQNIDVGLANIAE